MLPRLSNFLFNLLTPGQVPEAAAGKFSPANSSPTSPVTGPALNAAVACFRV